MTRCRLDGPWSVKRYCGGLADNSGPRLQVASSGAISGLHQLLRTCRSNKDGKCAEGSLRTLNPNHQVHATETLPRVLGVALAVRLRGMT